MSDLYDDATVEAAAQASFAAGAENAVREFALSLPVTWDDDLDDWEREHETLRTKAALDVAAPLIAAKALRDAADELLDQGVEPWDRNAMAIRTLRFRADQIEADHD